MTNQPETPTPPPCLLCGQAAGDLHNIPCVVPPHSFTLDPADAAMQRLGWESAGEQTSVFSGTDDGEPDPRD